MKVAHSGVVMPDHPVMKKAQKTAEKIWIKHGRDEGVTITCGKDGVHSAGSWHYYGAAVDLRTNYAGNGSYYERGNTHPYPASSSVWDDDQINEVYHELKAALPDYDVILHGSHIHVEPGDALATTWGLLL